MSVSVNDPAVFSRLQLAKALKEDPEHSVIFVRSRSNGPRFDDEDQFYLPRPTHLLIPPLLSITEPQQNDQDFTAQQSPRSPHSPHSQRNRVSSFSSSNSPRDSLRDSPKDSMFIPEERRGSLGKQTTLMDVRQSMLVSRQNNTVSSFSPSSSQRTSSILQQPKSPHEGQTVKTSRSSNSSNSRPSSVHNNSFLRSNPMTNNSSRPLSSHTNVQSRPNSVVTNQSRPPSSYNNSPSRPSSLVNQFTPQDSDESDIESSPRLNSKFNHLSILQTNQSRKNITAKLKKVKEENSDSEESDDEETDENESSDDIPLALKVKPVIKVASPNGSIKKSGGRIEEWLNNVSNDDLRSPRLSDYTANQTLNASPLGRGSTEHRRHRSSTYEPPIASQKSLSHSRRKSHSELSSQRQNNDLLNSPQLMVGRISPNQRQDSGYWARETLTTLSSDIRHQMLMNDSSSTTTTSTGSSANAILRERKNSAPNLRKTQHNRNGSGSSYGSRPHSPQVYATQLMYPPQIGSGHLSPQSYNMKPVNKSKHRDSQLPMNHSNMSLNIPEGGRNSHGHYTNESRRKLSNDHLNSGSRPNSGVYIQKHRVR